MDLILDTCALLSLSGIARKKLSSKTRKLISEADFVFVSACSLFEISLKVKRGQLSVFPFESSRSYWDRALEEYLLESLPVEGEDFDQATSLPDHHNDPFDRIIIAQAIRKACPIITYDRHFSAYEIKWYQ